MTVLTFVCVVMHAVHLNPLSCRTSVKCLWQWFLVGNCKMFLSRLHFHSQKQGNIVSGVWLDVLHQGLLGLVNWLKNWLVGCKEIAGIG